MISNKFNFNRINFLLILPLIIIGQACSPRPKSQSEYFTADDFKKIIKIDIHCHLVTERLAFMEQAKDDNFRILTINTDAPGEGTVAEQEKYALFQRKLFPDRLAYLTSFSMQGYDHPDWQKNSLAYLEESFKKGAIGMKVWKNIGMVEKDRNGKFIMIDDPKFDTIFNYLEKNGIPVCGHIGEPKNCWLPLEEMTVNGDRQYYKEHPEYHMYLHPEYPSHEELIAARDNLLRKHPGLRFMGAHLGSMEWSLEEMASRFERFPNMSVDMAARISHFENQSRTDWQKVRDFFIKYQDRIIYGTDQGDFPGAEADPVKFKAGIHEVWMRDWTFLTTDSTMTAPEVNGSFKGLKLSREVIEKIYYKNALNWFPGV